jgi:hypothetical protein
MHNEKACCMMLMSFKLSSHENLKTISSITVPNVNEGIHDVILKLLISLLNCLQARMISIRKFIN